MNLRSLAIIFLASSFWGLCFPTEGSAPRIPEWFRFSAVLDSPPQVNEKVGVIATLTALVGEIDDIRIQLHVPLGWLPATPTAHLDKIGKGESRTFYFPLQAGGPVPNGEIGCQFDARIPKNSIAAAIKAPTKDEMEAMVQAVKNLPERGGGFADIGFALFAEEGFYPLSSDMWVSYDDQLTPKGMIKGPVFYRDPVLSSFQAQTDVEMYERLVELMASDSKVIQTLETAGIDLEKKKQDYAIALYVLASEAYMKKNYALCQEMIKKFEKTTAEAKEGYLLELRIACGNLKGICFWAQGDRKNAEASFRDTFYINRKVPVQRYTLRNMALLLFDRGDKASAKEMLRLALELKPRYSLVKEEFNILAK